MMDKMHNMVVGIGSIISILPSRQAEDYSRFIPTESDEERMGQIWEQVGNDIKTAMEKFSGEYSINYSAR